MWFVLNISCTAEAYSKYTDKLMWGGLAAPGSAKCGVFHVWLCWRRGKDELSVFLLMAQTSTVCSLFSPCVCLTNLNVWLQSNRAWCLMLSLSGLIGIFDKSYSHWRFFFYVLGPARKMFLWRLTSVRGINPWKVIICDTSVV